MTLGIMAGTLGFLLVGVTALSQMLKVVPVANGSDTVLSQVGRAVYGNGGFFYFALQIATMAILFLGANTSYAGFPRLSFVLARDGLMPRQFMNRGDKLVFSNGIIGLTVAAIAVVLIFGAQTHRMIPLYAVGVFLSFTLSQSGMVVHWFKLRTNGWRRRAVMNGFGATLTAIVSVVILVTKFTHGAYLVVIAVAALIAVFYVVRRHYARIAYFLEPQNPAQLERLGQVAISRPRDDRAALRLEGERTDGPLPGPGPRTVSRRLPRSHHSQRPRAGPVAAADLAGHGDRHPSRRRGLTLSRVHPPGGGLHPVSPAWSGPHGDRDHPRVRGGALVGELPAQPERAAAQGCASGGSLGGGDQHPLPHRRHGGGVPAGVVCKTAGVWARMGRGLG